MFKNLSIQQRSFLLLSGLLLLVLIGLWIFIHPRYRDSVLEERTTIIEQLQHYSVSTLDQQIASWTAVTRYVASEILDRPADGESIVRSIIALNPEIISVSIKSEKLEDELSSQNTAYPPMKILIPAEQYFASKLDTSVTIAWVQSTGPTAHILALRKRFSLQDIDFTLNILWDARKLAAPLQQFPLGEGYALSLRSANNIVFSNSSNFHLQEFTPGANTSGHAQVVRQAEGGWRVLTTEFQSMSLWMIVAVPEQLFLEPVNRLFIFSSSAIAILFLALSIVGWTVSRRISKPIAGLVEEINRFSTLDFSQQITMPDVPELKAMGTTVESMRQVLDRYQKLNVEKIIFEEWKNKFFMTYSDDMIGILDHDGRFIFKNDKLSEFCNDLSGELAIETRDQLMTSPNLVKTKEAQRSEQSNNLTIQQSTAELRVTLHEGEPQYFRMQNVAIRSDEHDLGSMLIFHDLTLERQLDKMKSDMINVVVHELRNPLGSIMGFTQILMEDQNLTPEEKVEFLGLISTSSKNLNQLVNRFLDISRLESRKVDYPRLPANLLEITKLLLDAQKPQFMNKNLKAEFEFDPDLPQVTVAPDLIREAFMNLISNAVKYGDRDRVINVSLRRADNNAVFSITDHGYGIPPEAQKKLFSKFFRVMSNVKAAAEVGTGLGLAHVKEIVTFHGGTIVLESTPEIGCKFTITLPLDKEKSEETV